MKQLEEYDDLSGKLLQAFHTQFAENQRTREQSFLKIVGFLGAVVLGYAYAYQHLVDELNNAFSYVAIASVLLLLFGSIIVTIIAYSFRRDQYVNARIRKYAKVIGPDKPFPSSYNPYQIFQRKLGFICWMPDIFVVFYLVFPVFILIIIISYGTRQHLQFSISPADTFATVTVLISLVSVIISIFTLIWFGRKLKSKFNEWEKEYSTSTTKEPAHNEA